MPIIDAFLAELDHEAATTRRVLDRVPDGRFDWHPHERSMTIGRLAGHIAEIFGWGSTVLTSDEFDVATAAQKGWVAFSASDRAGLLDRFDRELAGFRQAAAAGVSDEHLRTPWSLRNGEHVAFTLPRAAALRTFIFNHMIHHRGQLSVYLRLAGVPVPSIYGPSADEAPA
ncbi:MAG TPA: DinB family protein [Thermoanaerobaculia bacterium]|nr:DinB family protein [Thermoanaerobaculia bacterium]